MGKNTHMPCLFDRSFELFELLQIVKALLTRGDPRALSLTENLFDLFSDEVINWDAASSIGKIAAATDVLTKTNYAVTKVRKRTP